MGFVHRQFEHRELVERGRQNGHREGRAQCRDAQDKLLEHQVPLDTYSSLKPNVWQCRLMRTRLLRKASLSADDFYAGTNSGIGRNGSGIPRDENDPRSLSGQSHQRVVDGATCDAERGEDSREIARDPLVRRDRIGEVRG